MLCKDGLQRWPDSASVYAQYGNFLYERKRYDEAWEMYSKADKLKPNEWGTRYQLIKVAAVSGSRIKEVLPWAAAYAAAPPTEDVTWKAYFHFRHGQLLEHNGDKRAAADAYRKALALKSDLEAAKKALDRVK
jgi:tetratricopeptide (TPR) repeat protein